VSVGTAIACARACAKVSKTQNTSIPGHAGTNLRLLQRGDRDGDAVWRRWQQVLWPWQARRDVVLHARSCEQVCAVSNEHAQPQLQAPAPRAECTPAGRR
jgi:hypothetical protein